MSEMIRMPFEGIGSFFGAVLLDSDEKAQDFQIVFMGVPYDMGTTNRPGARFGPRAIRDASQLYTYYASSGIATVNPEKSYEGLWDINNKKNILLGAKICDAGDVFIIPAAVEKSFHNITDAASLLLSKKVFPVFIGGDHSITYPILQAYSHYKNIHIIHFDTHIDTWKNVGGAELGHGSSLYHAQELKNVKTITHIGLHGFLNDEDRYSDALTKGHTIITADDIHCGRKVDFDKILPHKDNYYLTIDIDVCDPAYAPGTGTPEFGGLTAIQLFNMLPKVCKNRKFIGMDLVEVCPPYDHGQITAILASQILLVALGSIFPQK